MQKKKNVTIFLTATLFLATALLGFFSVYRVNEVGVSFKYNSAEAQVEVEFLKADLLALYKGENIFLLDEDVAGEVFDAYPYFRKTGFKREFPDKIIFEATEDEEIFAAYTDHGYLIIGLDGTILSIRDNFLNRADGHENILIEGIQVSGEKGEACVGNGLSDLFTLLQTLSNRLGGIRSNIVKIRSNTVAPSIVHYELIMREGVKIQIGKIESFTREKAEKIADLYLNPASDADRLRGVIYATDDGIKPIVSYSPTEFIGV